MGLLEKAYKLITEPLPKTTAQTGYKAGEKQLQEIDPHRRRKPGKLKKKSRVYHWPRPPKK